MRCGSDLSAQAEPLLGLQEVRAVPQPAGKRAVTAFQVKVGGQELTLQAKVVTRVGKPGVDEAAVYELPTGKPVAKPSGRTRGAVSDD